MIVVALASFIIAASAVPQVSQAALHTGARQHSYGSVRADSSAAGEQLVSPDGRFSITLPAGYSRPQLQTNSVESDNGTIRVHMYSAISANEGLCLIGYNDFKGATIDSILELRILDGAREGALENMQATLESERTLSLEGHPGRSIRFTARKNEQVMYGRFDYYLVGTRLYQVGFIGSSAASVESQPVASYFGSFKLMTNSRPAPHKRGRR
ncbi:MAG TPA: hypothetical protein VHI13_01845 [Candidatus Kapabacteria bacterium]|nr:hypothetical protein [Candidatus Kapabacteria bacterium]